MKNLARLLGILCGAVAVVVMRPVNSYQGFMIKATATAQSPALAVLAALTAVIGVIHRSLLVTLSGVFGAVVGIRYIRQVTAAHQGFERAFGAD